MCFPVKKNPVLACFRGKCGAVGRPLCFAAGYSVEGRGQALGHSPTEEGLASSPPPNEKEDAGPGREIVFCIALPQPGLAGQLLPSNGGGPAVAHQEGMETKALPGRAEPLGQPADIPPCFFTESDLEATERPGRPSLVSNNIF